MWECKFGDLVFNINMHVKTTFSSILQFTSTVSEHVKLTQRPHTVQPSTGASSPNTMKPVHSVNIDKFPLARNKTTQNPQLR